MKYHVLFTGTEDLTSVVELCGGLTGVPLAYVIPPLCALVLASQRFTHGVPVASSSELG